VAGNINVGSGSGNAVVANGNVVVTGSLIIAGTGGGVIPPGGIIMWSGAEINIPTGWLLCNGSNGTPDLRNRFVVGAGTGSSYAVGATGGSADAVVISHSHGITDPGHTHDSPPGLTGPYLTNPFNGDGSLDSSARTGPTERNTTTAATASRTTGITVNSEGVSGTNANLPPYYALCYIMKS
jgi:microcystin-dependent protein